MINVDETMRLRWISLHILPVEPEVRGWLRAHARTLDRADIEDAIQEAYARIWTADLAHVDNPRAYFFTVVRNLICERARRARVIPLERMGEIEALRIISDDPGPERSVSARQELGQVLKLVAALPAQCRRAFELRKFEGLSQRDIAAAMGIAEKTVEKHLAKALLRVTRGMLDSSTPVERMRRNLRLHDSANDR